MDGFDQPSSPEFVRPALLQEPAGRRIRCLTCERRCEIVPGELGWCRTRRHQDGTLLTLVYGDLSSLSANPIEKKPFFHFYPGTRALTSRSLSCNFGCLWCQNRDISQATPGGGRYISPQHFVGEAGTLPDPGDGPGPPGGTGHPRPIAGHGRPVRPVVPHPVSKGGERAENHPRHE